VFKPLFKAARVVNNTHLLQFEVEYKNWFAWTFDSCYQYRGTSERPGSSGRYLNEERARELAVARAESMLTTAVVWKKTAVG
jgi:hypothetical protein